MLPLAGRKRAASPNSTIVAEQEATSSRKPRSQTLTSDCESAGAKVDADECKADAGTAMSTEDVGTSKDEKSPPGVNNSETTTVEEIEFKHPLRGKVHIAIKSGNFALVRLMLEEGMKVCWHGKINCIILALKNGNMKLLKELLKAEPRAINFKDNKGQYVLSYCKENPAVFWWVLEQMKDPSIIPIDDVCTFIRNSTNEIQIKVLNHLKSINYVFNLETVLKNFRKNPEIIKLLVKNRFIKKKISKLNSTTLLHYCDNSKYLNIVKFFLMNSFVDTKTYISISTILNYMNEFSTSLPLMIQFYLDIGLVNSYLPPEDLEKMKVYFEDPLKLPVLKILSDCGLISLTDPQILNICARMLAYKSCYTEIAKKVIKHFQDLNLSLEDGNGKSLVHHTTDPEVQLYLLQELQANINPELQQEFLCELVNNRLQLEEIYKCLDIVSERGIVITGGENKSLFSMIRHVKVAEKLISLGCKDTIPPDILLSVSHSLFDLPLEEMKSLVNQLVAAGANMTATDVDQCSLYCHALNSSTSCSNIGLPVLEYILKHPAFQDDNFSFTCGVSRMCNHLPRDELLPILFQNKNFKKITCDDINNVSYQEMKSTFECYKIGLSAAIIDVELKKFIPQFRRMHELLTPFSFLKYSPKSSERVNQLLSAGLDLKQETDGVSSLTVWLFYCEQRYKPEVIESLISSGVNVESSVLVLKDERLRNLQQKLRVPDAFLLSTIRDTDNDELKFVHDYHAHLACSPTCLFLYIDRFALLPNNHGYKSLIRKSPRVPHGTLVFRSLCDKMEEIDLLDEFSNKSYKNKLADIFEDIHSHPLTLLELSRDAVRMSLADQAARSLTQSLPQMFDSLLPPGLNDKLIRKKIDNLIAERRAEISVAQ